MNTSTIHPYTHSETHSQSVERRTIVFAEQLSLSVLVPIGTLKCYVCFIRQASHKDGYIYIYIYEGFWGGLTPENAFNSTALDELLGAGALGLKVESFVSLFFICYYHLDMESRNCPYKKFYFLGI